MLDEARVREYAERHGKSVERGDMAAVASDLIEDLHPQLPVIGEILPNPCDKAEILSIEPRTTRSCTSATPVRRRR
jgi:hypothetical protein